MKVFNLLLALFVSVSLSACAMAGGTKEREQPPVVKKEEYLPFYIAIKADGTPVIKSYDGKEYPGSEVALPIRSRLIERFETISYIKYHGSCKIVMDLNGKKFEYILPDEYCSQYQ